MIIKLEQENERGSPGIMQLPFQIPFLRFCYLLSQSCGFLNQHLWSQLSGCCLACVRLFHFLNPLLTVPIELIGCEVS